MKAAGRLRLRWPALMTPDRLHPHRRRHGDDHRGRRLRGAGRARSSVGVMVAFVIFVQRFFEPVRMLSMQYTALQRAMAAGYRIFEVLDVPVTMIDKPDADRADRGRARPSSSTTSPSATTRTGRCCSDISFKVKPQAGGGAGRADRLGQDQHHLAGAPLLRGGRGPRAGRRPRRARRDAGQPRQDHRHGAAGAVPVHRHHRGEHPLRLRTRPTSRWSPAAKAVRAHDFIMRLPQGYDTPLGQRGRNISLGQRQLISFARALVIDPKILILDEATANIDSLHRAGDPAGAEGAVRRPHLPRHRPPPGHRARRRRDHRAAGRAHRRAGPARAS